MFDSSRQRSIRAMKIHHLVVFIHELDDHGQLSIEAVPRDFHEYRDCLRGLWRPAGPRPSHIKQIQRPNGTGPTGVGQYDSDPQRAAISGWPAAAAEWMFSSGLVVGVIRPSVGSSGPGAPPLLTERTNSARDVTTFTRSPVSRVARNCSGVMFVSSATNAIVSRSVSGHGSS